MPRIRRVLTLKWISENPEDRWRRVHVYTENVDQRSPSREIVQRLLDSQRKGRVVDNVIFCKRTWVKSKIVQIYMSFVFFLEISSWMSVFLLLHDLRFLTFLLFYLSFTLLKRACVTALVFLKSQCSYTRRTAGFTVKQVKRRAWYFSG